MPWQMTLCIELQQLWVAPQQPCVAVKPPPRSICSRTRSSSSSVVTPGTTWGTSASSTSAARCTALRIPSNPAASCSLIAPEREAGLASVPVISSVMLLLEDTIREFAEWHFPCLSKHYKTLDYDL